MKIPTHARDEMSWLPFDKPQQFAIAKIHIILTFMHSPSVYTRTCVSAHTLLIWQMVSAHQKLLLHPAIRRIKLLHSRKPVRQNIENY